MGECVRKLGVTNHQLIRGDVFRYLKSAQKSSTLSRGSAALPAAQQPYTAEDPYTPQSGHARGSAALPAAQQPYTAEGPYTPQSGHARGSAAFSFIFADPPYALPNLPDIPDLVLQSGILVPGGVFVFEHGKQNDFSSHPCFREHRAYGSVNFTIFTT
ncbi:MAG: RsmD family RNA methyltransferase [Prevotella sp.]|nr:RsmD family RNA methyltransferase [Prevotella sp.]